MPMLILLGCGKSSTEGANPNSQVQQSKIDGLDAAEWSVKGVGFYENNDSDNAIIAYNNAISLNPNDAEFYVLRGLAHNKKGLLDNAIADFDKAIAINPKHSTAYSFRGSSHYEKKLYDNAIADYNNAIANESDTEKIANYKKTLAIAYHTKSLTYMGEGFYDKALIEVNSAIALRSPENYRYYNTKARICDKLNRKSEAIECYRKFLQGAPAVAEDKNINYAKQRLQALGYYGSAGSENQKISNPKSQLMLSDSPGSDNDEWTIVGKDGEGVMLVNNNSIMVMKNNPNNIAFINAYVWNNIQPKGIKAAKFVVQATRYGYPIKTHTTAVNFLDANFASLGMVPGDKNKWDTIGDSLMIKTIEYCRSKVN